MRDSVAATTDQGSGDGVTALRLATNWKKWPQVRYVESHWFLPQCCRSRATGDRPTNLCCTLKPSPLLADNDDDNDDGCPLRRLATAVTKLV